MIPLLTKSFPGKIHETLPILNVKIPELSFTLFLWIILLIALIWLYKSIKSMQKDKPKDYLAKKININIKSKIGNLRKKHTDRESYRDGLHDLSIVLRNYMVESTGVAFEQMTSEEMKAYLDNPKTIEFFKNLTRYQYGKEFPEKEEFLKMYEEAGTLIKSNTINKLKKGAK
ncbi:MAG: hypothetical protein H7A24_17280 [Leptospiraceae bacterium]|nr:hypothetical protein [Leptospiraceae bacterium]MCP5513645.1 hypothetical protein [Leptospiraceae bacterium]